MTRGDKLYGEFLVSARKKVERLLDVPLPVSVIDCEALLDNNKCHLSDYYATVRGLSFSSFARKLSRREFLKFAALTVSIVMDDVPFGGEGLCCESAPDRLIYCQPIELKPKQFHIWLELTSTFPPQMVVCHRWEFLAGEVPDAHARGPPVRMTDESDIDL